MKKWQLNLINIKGGDGMKKFMVLMSIAVFIFILSSSAFAWEVTLQNGTPYPLKFEIYVEHLFWEQVDCTKEVPAKGTGTCTMPGAICPSSFQATPFVNGHWDTAPLRKTDRFALCWNTTARVSLDYQGVWFLILQ